MDASSGDHSSSLHTDRTHCLSPDWNSSFRMLWANRQANSAQSPTWPALETMTFSCQGPDWNRVLNETNRSNCQATGGATRPLQVGSWWHSAPPALPSLPLAQFPTSFFHPPLFIKPLGQSGKGVTQPLAHLLSSS